MENNQNKKSNIGKWLPWVICGISLFLLLSPIDLIPDPLVEVYGLGLYDDIGYLLSSIVSPVVGVVNLFKKR